MGGNSYDIWAKDPPENSTRPKGPTPGDVRPPPKEKAPGTMNPGSSKGLAFPVTDSPDMRLRNPPVRQFQ